MAWQWPPKVPRVSTLSSLLSLETSRNLEMMFPGMTTVLSSPLGMWLPCSILTLHCTVTSGHLFQDGIYQSQSENKVKRLFWFNFVLNRASANFAIYYKTHCDDRCKSEVDTKDWTIKMITWIIEHICAANHLLVMYKATYSLIIQICHLNSEI